MYYEMDWSMSPTKIPSNYESSSPAMILRPLAIWERPKPWNLLPEATTGPGCDSMWKTTSNHAIPAPGTKPHDNDRMDRYIHCKSLPDGGPQSRWISLSSSHSRMASTQSTSASIGSRRWPTSSPRQSKSPPKRQQNSTYAMSSSTTDSPTT